jgi:general stress protein YciG
MMLDDAEFVRQVKILFTSLIGMEEGLDPLADSIIVQYNEDHDRFSKAGKKGGEISAKSSLAQALLKPSSSQNQADKIRVDKNRENKDNTPLPPKGDCVGEEMSPAQVLFEEFRKAYPGTKQGHDAAWARFRRKAGRDHKEIAHKLMPALEREQAHRDRVKTAGAFLEPWKHLSTWINNHCWDQEFATDIVTPERRQSASERKRESQDKLMQEIMALNGFGGN